MTDDDPRFRFPRNRLPAPPIFVGPSSSKGRKYLSYDSKAVREKEISFLLKMLPSFGKKEKFVMEGWKSGVGLERKNTKRTNAARRGPVPVSRNARSRRPGGDRQSASGRKSDETLDLSGLCLDKQCEIVERRMKDAANALDFRGATAYKKKLEALRRRADERRDDADRRRCAVDVERRHKAVLVNIKNAMKPFIAAREFQKCIPLREDMMHVTKLKKQFEDADGEDEWKEAYDAINDIFCKYGA